MLLVYVLFKDAMIRSDDIASTGMMIIKGQTNGFEMLWKVSVVE